MITNQVRERRESVGLTQMQLAVQVETSPSHISRIEHGHVPNLPLALRLADKLGVPVEQLFRVVTDEAA